jgi:hypothetical protein
MYVGGFSGPHISLRTNSNNTLSGYPFQEFNHVLFSFDTRFMTKCFSLNEPTPFPIIWILIYFD